jgi:hypothetical protein
MKTTLLLLVLLLNACAFRSGDECTPIGAINCQDADTGLFCEGRGTTGHFVAYGCPGPNGCVSNGERTVCDMRNAKVGTACPVVQIGKGACQTPLEMRKCEAPKSSETYAYWSSTNCPSGCTEDSVSVTCK